MNREKEELKRSDKDKPYDALRLQISKVSEMADMGSKFSDAVSANHLLSMIVKQTLDLMDTDVCIIWLKDKTGNLLPRISFGLKSRFIQSVKVKLGPGILKCIMKKDSPTNIYNLVGNKYVSLKRLIEREGLKSLLASPLIVGDERIGILMVCTKFYRRFADVDLKIFNALARQSALAIANIGLYDRKDRIAKEKTKEMSMLFTMSRSLASSIDLDVLLNLILEKVRLLMKAEFCILKLLDKSRRRLVLASSIGLEKEKIDILSKFEDNISEKVLRTGTSLVITDIESYSKDKIPAYFKKNNIRSVLMVPLFSKKRKAGVLSVYISDVRIFEKEDMEMMEMVASLCAMAIDNATMLERIRKDYLNTIKTLAKIIDANDTYTRGHCDKVMRYSLRICRRLKLPARDVNTIKTASLFHDIGKIGIDLSIIRKPGKLTKDDWKRVRMHPEIGAKIINQVGFLDEIVPIVKYHHARFGGQGYPDPNKSGKNIPIGSRIIAVADAFDAMTSDRPYRKAMSKEEAVGELKRCSWSQFDPEIVNAFIN